MLAAQTVASLRRYKASIIVLSKRPCLAAGWLRVQRDTSMVQMAQLLPSPFTRVQVSGRHMPAWWDLAAPQGGGALLPLPLLAALLGLDLSQPWCSCPKAVLTAAPSCFHKAPLAAAATAIWAISPVSSISKAGSSCIRATCNASPCSRSPWA